MDRQAQRDIRRKLNCCHYHRIAFGDSNGFSAMAFTEEDESTMSAGMNTGHYDWKQLVLNVLHWLSQDQGNN